MDCKSKNKGRGLLVCLMVFCLGACTSIKPYQRAHLNDRDMQFGNEGAGTYEQTAHTYREGAQGGSSSKSKGGCGCN